MAKEKTKKDQLLNLSNSVNIDINVITEGEQSVIFTIGDQQIILTKKQTGKFLKGLKYSIDARVTIQ